MSVKSRESIKDVSDKLRARMAVHDEAVGAIMVANNKLAMSIDVHTEEFREGVVLLTSPLTCFNYGPWLLPL